MSLVTILTPTYNRADKLPFLYASLCAQTDPDWEWLVVDDGSRDDTAELVRGWKEPRVRYLAQENGGKHRALNTGIAQITSQLTLIVDSDDTLLPEAVETAAEFDRKYGAARKEQKLCGFSFLRVDRAGAVNGGAFPKDEFCSNYADARVNAGDEGDKAEVFYTDVLKLFPFPEFEGEKFLPEDAVWMEMSREWNMIFANRRIMVCDYLEGGLTRSGRAMKIHSPRGMMLRSAVYLASPQLKSPRVCCKMILLYQIYARFAWETQPALNDSGAAGKQESGQYPTDRDGREVQSPAFRKGFLYAVFRLPSFVLYRKWKRRYE